MDDPEIINEINEEEGLNASGLLPEKSADVYLRSYQKFMEWMKDQNINENSISESVMLMYFKNIKASYKPSSMMVEYSILKTMIAKYHNVDIKYAQLITFQKLNSIGFKPKKTNIFQPDDIQKFLSVADDVKFLAMKVIMIFGVTGITRADDLTRVEVGDVREEGNVFIIKIPETKTNVAHTRTFIVEDEYAAVIRKYIKLRPPTVGHNRFFVTFLKGKCTPQPIGRNKFLNTPKLIANFLNLEDADNYTGHSFRRTALKRHERHAACQSSNVVDGYIDESISNKRKIGHLITDESPSKKHASSTASIELSGPSTSGTLRCLESDPALELNSLVTNMKDSNWSNVRTEDNTIHNINPEKAESSIVLNSDLIPDAYLRSYDKFMEWKKEQNINENCISESVMLMYFENIKEKYKPSSLQVEYSMLKTMIARKFSVDMQYPKLITFLKKYSDGFQSKKPNIFQPDDIQKFLSDADDMNFLAMKVIMIFGINGTTSADELTKVDVNDVREEGNIFVIKIPQTKSNVVRTFTVEDDYAAIIRKYIKLRPSIVGHTRFFVNFRNGKCTAQCTPIGRNKFLNIPKQIANFLKLEGADNYTGHSFRRTSKSLLLGGSNWEMGNVRIKLQEEEIKTHTITIHSVENGANILEKNG